MLFLNADIKKHIMGFVYPTKIQMEHWKIDHFLNYYKCLEEIKDVIIEIKIGQNGEKIHLFSLFSWCEVVKYFNESLHITNEDVEINYITDYYSDIY